jgi:signal peptidase I
MAKRSSDPSNLPAADELKGKENKAKEKDKPHDGGWRETIESLAMAIILALLFKGYVAEAFVIPTGSMAPTLQGRHKDICCAQCGYWYQSTASEEVDRQGFITHQHVISGTCPICRYTQTYDALGRPNEGSFSGDRIIVSKFAYEIAEPQRWDVIVFKYPEEATQNYIKRLVGLPGERLTISGGNVYVRPASQPESTAVIARKPAHKLAAMLQIVDDSDHIPESLIKLGWPPRWREPGSSGGQASWKTADGGKSFACEVAPPELTWLRYRHVVPTYEDWEAVTINNRLPSDVSSRRGELITDYYAYNTSVLINAPREPWGPSPGNYRPSYGNHPINIDEVPDRLRASRGDEVKFAPDLAGPGIPCHDSYLGNHWVDDLALECLAEVQDSAGTIALNLVRGGVHHRCSIDIATGEAVLSRVNAAGKELEFDAAGAPSSANPKAATAVKGAGYYRLRLTNCDHELLLFVNGKPVSFDGQTRYASDEIVAPQWNAQDGLDLEPAGVGVQGARVKLSHLRIYRDKYYIAIDGQDRALTDYENDYAYGATPPGKPTLPDVFASPDQWSSSGLFEPNNRRAVEFEIGADQFFPMGDNSPGSYDARYWLPSNYVERDLLIGKALVIYWPHSWNRPPFAPNFKRMGRIR